MMGQVMFRSLAIATLLATVSACVGVSNETTSAIALDHPVRDGIGYTLVENASPTDAHVTFDALRARMVAMDERVYAQGIAQHLVFSADAAVFGENHTEIRVTSKRRFGAASDELTLHESDANGLRKDFRRAFPNRPFTLDPRVHSNSYGIFGLSYLSIGRNVGCLYGWQQVEAKVTDKQRKDKLIGWMRDRSNAGHGAKLSYRLRYCAKGLTQDGAIAIMQSARIDVPADVFAREQKLRWRGTDSYASSASHAEDLNYVTTPPANKAGNADRKPVKTSRAAASKKPVRRASSKTSTPKRSAPLTVARAQPVVPMPSTSGVSATNTPAVPINRAVPVIEANRPAIGDEKPVLAVPNAIQPSVTPTGPGIVPLPSSDASAVAYTPPSMQAIQPKTAARASTRQTSINRTPRIIPLTPQSIPTTDAHVMTTLPACIEGNNHSPQCRTRK